MVNNFALAAFLCMLHASLSQVITPGKCPTVTTKADFDLKEYLGDWYEIVKFKANFEGDQGCIIANYKLKDDGHIQVNNTGFDSDGNAINAVGDAFIPDEKEASKLKVRFSKLAPYGNYWVLDTDYKDYTLIYSCGDVVGLFKTEFAWILSRKRTLEADTRKKLYDMMDSFGIKTSNFLPDTPQENCPV